MLKIVVVSLSLLLAITSVSSIKCYSCISAENPDCENPEKSNMESTKCDYTGLFKTRDYASNLNKAFSNIFEVSTFEKIIPLNCLKQVVKVEGKEIILRGCQLPKDSTNQLDVCKKVFEIQNKNNFHVMHCSLCDTDGCNISSHPEMSQICLILGTFLCICLLRW